MSNPTDCANPYPSPSEQAALAAKYAQPTRSDPSATLTRPAGRAPARPVPGVATPRTGTPTTPGTRTAFSAKNPAPAAATSARQRQGPTVKFGEQVCYTPRGTSGLVAGKTKQDGFLAFVTHVWEDGTVNLNVLGDATFGSPGQLLARVAGADIARAGCFHAPGSQPAQRATGSTAAYPTDLQGNRLTRNASGQYIDGRGAVVQTSNVIQPGSRVNQPQGPVLRVGGTGYQNQGQAEAQYGTPGYGQPGYYGRGDPRVNDPRSGNVQQGTQYPNQPSESANRDPNEANYSRAASEQATIDANRGRLSGRFSGSPAPRGPSVVNVDPAAQAEIDRLAGR